MKPPPRWKIDEDKARMQKRILNRKRQRELSKLQNITAQDVDGKQNADIAEKADDH
jgi:hypothetical protein